MSRIDTVVCTDTRKTKYRFVVLTMIFLVYAINYADRTNIGAVLPFIIDEFHINNFEAGAIASMFFLGYAVSQIPAGFFIAKRGTRGLVSLSIFGFSAFTWLMGTVSSVFGLKLVRLGLGLSEGPCPVGLASTINSWFPPKEKATATGVYIAATMFAPIIVPPLAVWIAVTWGWRWVFFSFAIPGLVAAIAWYVLVKTKPSESRFVSASELEDIHAGHHDHTGKRENIVIDDKFRWLDKIIRVRKRAPVDTAKGLFTSKNILGDCLAYFMMVSVLYGLLTWIPLYLVKEKGFDFMSMGLVASMPCIGGFVGAIGGGYISDKLLGRRRKPTMIFTAISTVIMMLIMLNIPASTAAVCTGLFFVGLCLNIGWPAFTAYGMAVSDARTYPIASSIINSGGNLGGFVSPMVAGFLLDNTGSFNSVFTYFGICAAIGLVVILFIDEPQ
ncbi:MFS transporter [Citrobacter rodentium]|jgi:Sugar phosphate permease|uniref:Major Facilitator Superfamily transporter n=2 Tax=Citrobacter rodentium TaxID=67825 RepID=D2TQA9_CITRI|nr:MFS transporter [Citrobacter rodentium]KIQ52357.1 DgoT [Citrobacter rodentium]QBY27443.1 MFS transporter [Citrobacter rodentium]CBG87575.1 Major Facilitator Superfamily transporter [Citrobacter rodentium ICC168]HAT8013328.1 MFS transporter [Citrobacter rodentium NBRC 105723 = DSM 16636]HAT8018415.1 MFS transporter [Citrobacter rodentium]